MRHYHGLRSARESESYGNPSRTLWVIPQNETPPVTHQTMRRPLSLMTMRHPLSLMTCKYIPPRSITNPFRTAATVFFSHYAPSVGVIDRPCCPVCPDERDTKAHHTQCSPPTHTPHTCHRALIAYSPHRTQGKPRTVWWAFLLLVTGVASIPVMVWLANR